ncbi:MAG: ribonuclease H-like domain-containing protein [Chloroflexi bacterium]|nr:ribonuclease H-like domain-containing protein [Chloroflexota bacterium]
MLESSFIHFSGIGPVGEARLWQRGFLNWDDVRERGEADRIASRGRLDAEESRLQLRRRNAAYFHAALPPSQRWRVYDDFMAESAFLDIETTGLSPGESSVTVVGVLDATGYTAYVRGVNLDEFPEAAQRYRLVVTFNGAAFDVPFLQVEFASVARTDVAPLFADAAHLDLRYPLRRIGQAGGLKAIERRLALGRPDELSLLDGFDAVRLWRMHCDGEPDALATLVRYNAEDVASLPALAEYVVDVLARGTPLARRARPSSCPQIDRASLPFDPGLVEYLTRGRI